VHCSTWQVEIDVLTGDHEVLRADLLVDLGSSINPALDIGQIEGAFTQGMGWSTTEELMWGDADHAWVRPAGRLFTQGPGTYKLPAFNDTPREFNVRLMVRPSHAMPFERCALRVPFERGALRPRAAYRRRLCGVSAAPPCASVAAPFRVLCLSLLHHHIGAPNFTTNALHHSGTSVALPRCRAAALPRCRAAALPRCP
jgi:hypothetical protein